MVGLSGGMGLKIYHNYYIQARNVLSPDNRELPIVEWKLLASHIQVGLAAFCGQVLDVSSVDICCALQGCQVTRRKTA